ncbi:MAG TPA: alpha-1,4-glucan--maltose-1-phosphate maltosyltransferase [Cyclobacteriaceae bacterium]
MEGKNRVIIENVQPVVDGGRYAARRAVGERVDVGANIFADGHDHLRARVLYKKEGAGNWSEIEMKPASNDEWQASFYVTEKGHYRFKVEAWVDHFDTWFDGFRKKAEARVDVKTELMEGVNFLRRFVQADASLKSFITTLDNRSDYDGAVAAVMSPAFADVVHHHPLLENQTITDEYVVKVEYTKVLFSTWYELFPRSASQQKNHRGTFKDVVKLLPRVSAMGFDVLYLPPIHPIGKLNRKGKNNNVRAAEGEPGSPWAIGSDEGGHKSVHPELGTLDDYRNLISKAKEVGIDIALDLAFQCAPDHPYVKEHPDWFRQRPDGTIQYAENPPKKYQDIYPFNFESENWKSLWDELKSVIVFWIEQGVTIFRVDNPHTKPIPFWEWAIAEVQKQYPDTIFLAEAFTKPKVMASLGKIGFNQSYTYFTWRVSKQEIIEYVNELVNTASRNYYRPNFWPNTPDILPYHLQHQGENIFIIRYALAATLSSNYGMYGPAYEFYDNTPMEGKEEYYNSEKYEIKWHDWKATNRMTDIISMVNRFRKENKALQTTWNTVFCSVENGQLLAYVKATDDLSNIILVVVNLDQHNQQSGYVQVPKGVLKVGDKINLKLRDLMTDEHYMWTQEWNFVSLNPNKMPFHMFQVSIHDSNM